MENKEERKSAFSRRSVLKGGVAGLAAPLLGSAFVGRAQSQEPINLGLVIAKSGVFAPQGQSYADGAEVALAQAGGKILGQDARLIWYDEPSPQDAVQNFNKLAEQDKAIAVIGGSNSSTALAMSAVAAEQRLPLVTPGASAREITGERCNPYTFRTIPTTQAFVEAIMPTLGGIGKNWYFLCATYAWGQDIYRTMKGKLDDAGGKELGNDQVAGGTTDFSGYILKIRAAKPDLVVLGIAGADIVNFLKQWAEMGMKDKIPVTCPTVSDVQLWEVGPDAATGIYGMPWYYKDSKNTAADQEFVQAIMDRTGAPPPLTAWLSWKSTTLMIDAINAAGTRDPNEIVKALESIRQEDGGLPSYYRDFDHQLVRRCLVVKVKDKIEDGHDYLEPLGSVPESAEGFGSIYGTPETIACKMPALAD